MRQSFNDIVRRKSAVETNGSVPDLCSPFRVSNFGGLVKAIRLRAEHDYKQYLKVKATPVTIIPSKMLIQLLDKLDEMNESVGFAP